MRKYIKVYMTQGQVDAVKEYAEKDNRSVSNFIYNAIDYKMSQSKKRDDNGELIVFHK